jgi:hypothetical protein
VCLTETCSIAWVGKNFDLFALRNGLQQYALSPLLFNFAVEYAIKMIQMNQDGLLFSGTHQLLVYTDDDNMLGGSVHTIKENAEALIVASKEIGLEVNADKTKYVAMSQDQNAIGSVCCAS